MYYLKKLKSRPVMAEEPQDHFLRPGSELPPHQVFHLPNLFFLWTGPTTLRSSKLLFVIFEWCRPPRMSVLDICLRLLVYHLASGNGHAAQNFVVRKQENTFSRIILALGTQSLWFSSHILSRVSIMLSVTGLISRALISRNTSCDARAPPPSALSVSALSRSLQRSLTYRAWTNDIFAKYSIPKFLTTRWGCRPGWSAHRQSLKTWCSTWRCVDFIFCGEGRIVETPQESQNLSVHFQANSLPPQNPLDVPVEHNPWS